MGPYTVVRATRRVSTARFCNIIGTFQARHGGSAEQGFWSEDIMYSDVNAALSISAAGNTSAFTIPLHQLGDAATLVPAALSVQIINPEALSATTGVVYAGVMNTQAGFGGRTDTWLALFDNFVEFQNPRVLSAGKLALRGVQINSYPLNMSEVSKFSPLNHVQDRDIAWSTSESEPTGFAPILVYNTGGIALEFLITVEYRLRFDLAHPAAASHKFHGVASDATWADKLEKAVALGNGVLDIVERVANSGMVQSAMRGVL